MISCAPTVEKEGYCQNYNIIFASMEKIKNKKYYVLYILKGFTYGRDA
jgi:hypothetical protein